MLGLKIILHFGNEIAPAPIGKHIKLMVEDVIIAYRLLKNDVPIDEYILISDALLDQYEIDENSVIVLNNMQRSQMVDEHIGRIPFRYIELKNTI